MKTVYLMCATIVGNTSTIYALVEFIQTVMLPTRELNHDHLMACVQNYLVSIFVWIVLVVVYLRAFKVNISSLKADSIDCSDPVAGSKCLFSFSCISAILISTSMLVLFAIIGMVTSDSSTSNALSMSFVVSGAIVMFAVLIACVARCLKKL